VIFEDDLCGHDQGLMQKVVEYEGLRWMDCDAIEGSLWLEVGNLFLCGFCLFRETVWSPDVVRFFNESEGLVDCWLQRPRCWEGLVRA